MSKSKVFSNHRFCINVVDLDGTYHNITMHTADLFQKEDKNGHGQDAFSVSLGQSLKGFSLSLSLKVRLMCTVLTLSHSHWFPNKKECCTARSYTRDVVWNRNPVVFDTHIYIYK